MPCEFAAAKAFIEGRDFRSPLTTNARWRDVVTCDDFGNVRWVVETIGTVAHRHQGEVRLDDRGNRIRAIHGRLNAVLSHYGQPTIKATDYRWHRVGVGPWPGSTMFYDPGHVGLDAKPASD